jgi:beta-glucanase (GH16 family)
MRIVLMALITAVLASCAAASKPLEDARRIKTQEDKITQWVPVWSDEFDAPKIDATKWGFERGNNFGWGNSELEYYTDRPENASIQMVDGTSSLVITARREQATDGLRTFDYTSARMLTQGKFAMASGRLDIRAKLPRGQGLWPAIWLLGANIDSDPWPNCGEIDLMELLGHQPGLIHSTVHGPISGGPGIGQPYQLPGGASFADAFHIFTLEWRPDHLEFLVDGQLFFVVTKSKIVADHGESEWVYDHPFFLLLNVAVGGGWPGNPDATTSFPQSMAVDYVRVYKNVGSELKPDEMPSAP